MSATWTATIAIVGLKNVPSMGHDTAATNGAHTDAQEPDLGAVTERWNTAVTRGYFDGLGPAYDHFAPDGQSVALFWKTSTWTCEHRAVLFGAASRMIPRVTDRRDLPWVRLRHNATGRKLILAGVHTAPIPTKKAPWKVPAAKASHLAARRRFRRFAAARALPVLFAGDFNAAVFMPGADLHIGNGIGDKIIHAEGFDGDHVELHRVSARTFALRSDHPGVLARIEAVAR